MVFLYYGYQEEYMLVLKKQCIDLRLIDDDKSIIEEVVVMFNQSIIQFMVSSVFECVVKVIE